MARLTLNTYSDAVQHLVDYLGAATGEDNVRFARGAVQDAYKEFANVHQWSYYFTRGRCNTVVPQNTGTIAFTFSSLTVTLCDATWPSWVLQGVLVIQNVPYQIASNPTSTTITLTPQASPAADIVSGTGYTLYQDAYPCPIDLVETDEIVNLVNSLDLEFEHPSTWLTLQRVYRGPATPRTYTIMGSSTQYGELTFRFYPPPDNVYPLDFIYKRRPRPMVYADVNQGKVSTTNGQVTVTGTGTAFTPDMVGSVIRFSAVGNTKTPTGIEGQNPFSYERTIVAYSSPTSITIDADPGLTSSGVYYNISDPIDIEEGAMLSFFWRYCESKMRMKRRMTALPEEIQLYTECMERAMEADNRSSSRQVVNGSRGFGRRLRDYPGGIGPGFDQG